MTVVLRHSGHWTEIHTPYTWPDQVTHQPTSYICGFPPPDSEAKARAHAARWGMTVIG